LKRYILFAGVNGAGKTTLYQTNDGYSDMPRINMDEIVREFGSWRVAADVSKAGMLAVRKINEYFNAGITFNQETTLCGHTIFNNISRAKQLGYEIYLNYVGLNSVELAKERVEIRVKNGGHGIPEEDIERRYFESIRNMEMIIPMCDHVKIYDNSRSFTKIASFVKGKCVDCTELVPEWCKSIIDKNLCH
jgi:predicted ABC-type ATPase